MSHLDYVLQKQQQLTERSAIKPVDQIQPVRQYNPHSFNVPQNFQRIDPYFYPYFYPPPVQANVFYNNGPFFTPDFARQNPMMHAYPAPVPQANIHFNPNLLMQTNTNPQELHQIPRMNSNILNYQGIPRQISNKVHVNPALLNQSRIPVDVPHNNLQMPQNEQLATNNWHYNLAVLNQQNIPTSVPIHVNPKFIAKPMASETYRENKAFQQNRDISVIPTDQNIVTESGPSCSTVNTGNFTSSPSYSKSTIPVASAEGNCVTSVTSVSTKKLTQNSRVFKRTPSSGLISLSKRKLIRVKRNNTNTSITNSTPLKRKLSSSGFKKTKISPKNKNKLVKINNMKLVRATDTHSWYKKKNVLINNNSKNKKVALVDGVMFQISRNKIVRSSSVNAAAIKKQRTSSLNRSSQFITLRGGKTLFKVDSGLKKINNSPKIDVSNITSISPVKSYKSNASNKVKQRSLQILRNKMRKNNQPCLLFQKYGYCNNQLKGTCSKVHDKKQVAVCKNFLQGKCLSNDCLLSHDVGPEKMPTCKFFLEGFCTREGCPYLHVKVSSKNPICVEFLRGYCSRGNECQNRHIYACPEFDRTGACSKGKSCPYPHKSHLTKTKRPSQGSCRKSVTAAKSPEISPSTSEVKTNTRYYELEPTCNHDTEDLSTTRVRLLRKVKIMSGKTLDSSQENETSSDTNLETEDEPIKMCNRKKPMGPADPFIPIT